MNSFQKYLFFIIISTILIWFVFFRVEINPTSERIYSFLITKENTKKNSPTVFSTNISTINQEVLSSWLLFYYYPQGNFYLFEIDDATRVKTNNGFYTSINKNKIFLKQKIAKYYGIKKFDFEIHFSQKDLLNFLYRQGGFLFFNLHSTTLPLGEVYISSINYTNFLAGIDNHYLQKITALGFWFNLLMSFQENLPHQIYTEDFLKNFYNIFSGNLNYSTFKTLLKQLLFLENPDNEYSYLRDRITFKVDKNNIENISSNQMPVFTPYQEGTYDRNKITEELKKLSETHKQLNNQNITAQIKNATTVKRLAARAAGFFRLRGINIVEYLGFSTILKHSIILDFSNHPLKRKYIKKVTKINKIYHLFNYRENYDFGIYLGEDLYVLQNKTNSK